MFRSHIQKQGYLYVFAAQVCYCLSLNIIRLKLFLQALNTEAAGCKILLKSAVRSAYVALKLSNQIFFFLWGCRKRKEDWRGKMKKERKGEGRMGQMWHTKLMQIFLQVCRFYIWRTNVWQTSNEVQYNVNTQKHTTPHRHVSYSYQGFCIYCDNFYTIEEGK